MPTPGQTIDLDRASAADAGLRYVTDDGPGISRQRSGRGFSYRHPDGSLVASTAERRRIAELAIPPAWTDVWICPHPTGHVLATGRDDLGRKQYLYHPAWRELRDRTKFERMPGFGAGLPDLRMQVETDLQARGLPRRKVVALVVRLLDDTLIRVGNRVGPESNAVGLTTFAEEHVEVEGGELHFDFVGKGGIDRVLTLEDRRLARIVHQCSELGGQHLFAYESRGVAREVTSGDVNDYLRAHSGDDVTAKDFRTWGGSTTAAVALAITRPPEDPDGRAAEQAVLGAIDVAAEVLGNTRAVCRASYVHPAVPEAFRSGELREAWCRSRSGAHLDRGERTLLKVI